MNPDYEAVDFSAVLEQFARYASSDRTLRRIRQSAPIEDAAEIRRQLELTAQAGAWLQNGGSVSLGGLGDIDPLLRTARKGTALLPGELLQVSLFIGAARAAAHAFGDEYPALFELAQALTDHQKLGKEIDAAIDLSGQVRMDASPHLMNLESKRLEAKAALAAAARRFIKSAGSSLMDTTTTTVGGRLCVLVRAVDKYKFGGMVHGSSQSGAACYLEPGVLVEGNNRLRSIELEIEEEKKRICTQLSARVGASADSLLSDGETLELIDFTLAKGQWMQNRDGCVALINSASHALRIEHAIHPLLDPDSAVANSFRLGEGKNALLITGSNTGGKTVILKTIGLFSLLTRCGFPVSAHDALIPLYDDFYFVIGDQQSIEENLSTFSAHLKSLADILEHADSNSFVLLDEIGGGTDPAEGAALAQAVLEELIARRATVVASTHYGTLKAFGKTDPRVLCGSVEFDLQTLRPTYRYLPGASGASFAFDIAGQYGMSESILERARAIQKERQSESDRQIAVLEKQQAQVQKQKDRFEALVFDAHRLQKEAAEDQAKWERMKKRFDAEYETKLEDMLFEKREEARAIIRDLKQSTHKASHEQIEQLGRLSALSDKAVSDKAPAAKREFAAGDYVRIEALGNHGEIQSIKKGKATVLVNGRRVTVSSDQLTLMKKPQAEPSSRKAHVDRTFKAFPMELNLIGMHVEEGLDALEHYLDQAVYHRVKNVRIIHGVGTGALRSAVWRDLQHHPQVREITAAPPSQGGLGATLVELK